MTGISISGQARSTTVAVGVIVVALLACKGQKPATEESTRDEANTEQAGARDEQNPSGCPGTNTVALSNLDAVNKKLVVPATISISKGIGWYQGMQGSGKTSKHAFVALASYDDVRLTSWGLDMPKDEGKVAVQIDFSSEFQEATTDEQKKVYASLSVPPGDYPPGRMLPKTVDVIVYVGGVSGGYSILSGDTSKFEGKGVLAKASDGELCGTFDITAPTGASAKGSFSVKVEKDLWAQ